MDKKIVQWFISNSLNYSCIAITLDSSYYIDSKCHTYKAIKVQNMVEII